MKKALFIVAALTTTLTASAQKADTARLIVHYKFSHIRDTTQRDKPYTENMVLFAGQNASVYKSYDRNVQNALMKKQIEEQVAAQKGSGNMRINISNRVPTSNAEYYIFNVDGKLIDKENLIATAYLIEQPIPKINWTITGDTSTIGGLHCQKATGPFKGRDYTVWFAPDVPFHVGPWKLNGLPGLIVDAHDKKNEVIFKFDSMEEATPAAKVHATVTNAAPGAKLFDVADGNADPNVIAVPVNAVKTTQKEFDKLSEAMRKDPQGFMKSAMGSSGGSFSPRPDGAGHASGLGAITSVNIVAGPRAAVNNPIELPEKP
ncbi:GLPGLI family protein [Mucilaginibacter ximonensis]|uniref:GLPGLI family protein n=1 Tax=Mucilaginibacter ximonensis TaxID=538021 RepID=A0ABW5Y7R1_9SPHI